MGSTIGNICKISIFGESHGPAIGVTIDSFPAGISLDEDFIAGEMARRRPSSGAFSTQRRESDEYEILSGVLDGVTTGAPITAIIRNTNAHSGDYDNLHILPRPSHADYTAQLRYNGYQDVRGGGHFSGRLTAPLVFAGALCKLALEEYDIHIVSHIANIGPAYDKGFELTGVSPKIVDDLSMDSFPVMDSGARIQMQTLIEDARSRGDSVGGSVECAVINPPLGLGSPMFGGVENTLAQILFGIPAVKGLEFGLGFKLSELNGSHANDAMYYDSNGVVKTKTNNNGGIVGGITNGMPIVFRVAIKPTPSIALEQETVNLESGVDDTLKIVGRHDPCIVPRALPVIEAATAVALLDLTLMKNGYSK